MYLTGASGALLALLLSNQALAYYNLQWVPRGSTPPSVEQTEGYYLIGWEHTGSTSGHEATNKDVPVIRADTRTTTLGNKAKWNRVETYGEEEGEPTPHLNGFHYWVTSDGYERWKSKPGAVSEPKSHPLMGLRWNKEIVNGENGGPVEIMVLQTTRVTPRQRLQNRVLRFGVPWALFFCPALSEEYLGLADTGTSKDVAAEALVEGFKNQINLDVVLQLPPGDGEVKIVREEHIARPDITGSTYRHFVDDIWKNEWNLEGGPWWLCPSQKKADRFTVRMSTRPLHHLRCLQGDLVSIKRGEESEPEESDEGLEREIDALISDSRVHGGDNAKSKFNGGTQPVLGSQGENEPLLEISSQKDIEIGPSEPEQDIAERELRLGMTKKLENMERNYNTNRKTMVAEMRENGESEEEIQVAIAMLETEREAAMRANMDALEREVQRIRGQGQPPVDPPKSEKDAVIEGPAAQPKPIREDKGRQPERAIEPPKKQYKDPSEAHVFEETSKNFPSLKEMRDNLGGLEVGWRLARDLNWFTILRDSPPNTFTRSHIRLLQQLYSDIFDELERTPDKNSKKAKRLRSLLNNVKSALRILRVAPAKFDLEYVPKDPVGEKKIEPKPIEKNKDIQKGTGADKTKTSQPPTGKKQKQPKKDRRKTSRELEAEEAVAPEATVEVKNEVIENVADAEAENQDDAGNPQPENIEVRPQDAVAAAAEPQNAPLQRTDLYAETEDVPGQRTFSKDPAVAQKQRQDFLRKLRADLEEFEKDVVRGFTRADIVRLQDLRDRLHTVTKGQVRKSNGVVTKEIAKQNEHSGGLKAEIDKLKAQPLTSDNFETGIKTFVKLAESLTDSEEIPIIRLREVATLLKEDLEGIKNQLKGSSASGGKKQNRDPAKAKVQGATLAAGKIDDIMARAEFAFEFISIGHRAEALIDTAADMSAEEVQSKVAELNAQIERALNAANTLRHPSFRSDSETLTEIATQLRAAAASARFEKELVAWKDDFEAYKSFEDAQSDDAQMLTTKLMERYKTLTGLQPSLPTGTSKEMASVNEDRNFILSREPKTPPAEKSNSLKEFAAAEAQRKRESLELKKKAKQEQKLAEEQKKAEERKLAEKLAAERAKKATLEKKSERITGELMGLVENTQRLAFKIDNMRVELDQMGNTGAFGVKDLEKAEQAHDAWVKLEQENGFKFLSLAAELESTLKALGKDMRYIHPGLETVRKKLSAAKDTWEREVAAKLDKPKIRAEADEFFKGVLEADPTGPEVEPTESILHLKAHRLQVLYKMMELIIVERMRYISGEGYNMGFQHQMQNIRFHLRGLKNILKRNPGDEQRGPANTANELERINAQFKEARASAYKLLRYVLRLEYTRGSELLHKLQDIWQIYSTGASDDLLQEEEEPEIDGDASQATDKSELLFEGLDRLHVLDRNDLMFAMFDVVGRARLKIEQELNEGEGRIKNCIDNVENNDKRWASFRADRKKNGHENVHDLDKNTVAIHEATTQLTGSITKSMDTIIDMLHSLRMTDLKFAKKIEDRLMKLQREYKQKYTLKYLRESEDKSD